MRNNGFTLVEMLVALGIFALLAGAGVGLLRSSLDVQSSVDARLTAMGSIARLNALLSSDLGQVVDRPSRAPGGERPAFVGDPNGMAFISAGHANLDGAPRSELQRLEWRGEGSTLSRSAFTALDGSDEAVSSALVRELRSASFRYRTLDGSWGSSFTSTPQRPLPSAVELTITPSSGAPVVMVLALPSGAADLRPSGQGA